GSRRASPRGSRAVRSVSSCSFVLRPSALSLSRSNGSWRFGHVGADPQARERVARRRLSMVSVRTGLVARSMIEAAAAVIGAVWLGVRAHPLPDIAGEIRHGEGAVAHGVGAYLVGAEGGRLLAVGEIEVGVVRGEPLAVRERAAIGAAG